MLKTRKIHLLSEKESIAQNRLIVIIDDSTTVRKIVETCLGREGFEVQGFPDGVAALRWFLSEEGRIPFLIFLDIVMPKMDGFEALCRLRKSAQFDNTAIVMLTRRDGMLDRLKGRLAGAQAYLTKPFQVQEILTVAATYACAPSSQHRQAAQQPQTPAFRSGVTLLQRGETR